MFEILRGQIWLVNLDPTVGAEIKKTRPAVIVSNNLNNKYAATITVLPITDRGEKIYSFEVPLKQGSGLTKESKIKCQQIRTIDKSRLIKLLGKIESSDVTKMNEAISIHLDLLNLSGI